MFLERKIKKEPDVQNQKTLHLEFFPEGGNFISALMNTIAFKATGENGMPAAVSGKIKNEKDEVLAAFNTYHDGMGMFDLSPVTNEKYYAVINEDATGHKYYLPEQTDKGVVFRIISTGANKYFELLQAKNNPLYRAAYMIGQMAAPYCIQAGFCAGEGRNFRNY